MSLNPNTIDKIIDRDEPDALTMLRLLAVRLRKEGESLKKYAEWIISQADDNINIADEIDSFLNRSS